VRRSRFGQTAAQRTSFQRRRSNSFVSSVSSNPSARAS
jgi:hypothetical protein